MTTIDVQEPTTAAVGLPRGSSPLAVGGTVLVLAELVWLAISSGQVIADGGDPWQTGDWLIDLASGPVRRGLFGELLFTVIGSSSVLWLTFAVQIGLLAALTGLTLLLFWRSPRTPAWSMRGGLLRSGSPTSTRSSTTCSSSAS